MNPEFHLHDYSNEPRLRDMPRTVGNWPRILFVFDPLVSNDDLEGLTAEHLPFLSILFALWIPGNLQAWSIQGVVHGGVARSAM